MSKDINNEYLYPYSPDVLERRNSDNQFSKGWGMHFIPSEKYWIDVHTHLRGNSLSELKLCVETYTSKILALNLEKTVVILNMDGSSESDFISYVMELKKYDNLILMLYLDYKNPNVNFIEKCIQMGIQGIKLHNAPIIVEGADYNIWHSEEWGKVFKIIAKYNLPVLWHVTQRLSSCPYTGGGENTYWKDGWKKGVEYTNEDLLQSYLKIIKKHSDINFISAHQLHVGWKRLVDLFQEYNNLYIDTSIGCFVRKFDQIYDHDRQFLRDIFIKHSDRILFGTDLIMDKNVSDDHIISNFYGHMRFVKQLMLPHDVIQKVSHENAEKLFGL